MELILLPLLLGCLVCAIPGLRLGFAAIGRSTRKLGSLVFYLSVTAAAAVAAFSIPFLLAYGSSISQWSLFLREFTIGPGILFVLGVVFVFLDSASDSSRLGIAAGAMFLATALIPVLWFSVGERYVELLGITLQY